MAKKRPFSTFNLAFLDIMSCGFGAVVLIFLMIDHASNVHSEEVNATLLSEVNLLDEEIIEGQENLVRVKNTIAEVDQRFAEAQGLSRQILEEIDNTRDELAFYQSDTLAQREHINNLKSDIKSLEEEKKRLEAAGELQQGDNIRQVIGDGDRQYLTGLQVGGNRILILLDSSASMLDHSIVNIIRRRNMDDEVKRNAEKWQRAVGTVEWLLAQFPRESWFQVYHFNTDVQSLVPDTLGEWLEVENTSQVDDTIQQLQQIIPVGPTDLENVFDAVRDMAPQPDNLILITDGLPTQGSRKTRGNTVSGRERQRLFTRAVEALPTGIPVNIILTPLEGDPMAASSYWKLAIATGGSFLSPSRDWP